METPTKFIHWWIFGMMFIAMIYFLITGWRRDAANYEPRHKTHISLP